MNDNLCHCGIPAPWLLRVVANGESYSEAAWATCDEHLAEAARQLLARDMTGRTLQLRSEAPQTTAADDVCNACGVYVKGGNDPAVMSQHDCEGEEQ